MGAFEAIGIGIDALLTQRGGFLAADIDQLGGVLNRRPFRARYIFGGVVFLFGHMRRIRVSLVSGLPALRNNWRTPENITGAVTV